MPSIIPIANEYPLSARQHATLRLLAGLMIPASARHGVPGADDEIIFNDILNTLAPQAGRVSEMLRELDALAGQPFATLSAAQQDSLAQAFRKHRSLGLLAAVSATVQCYYRDDRVMRSLGMEARPPFPGGFEVEQGDWSLLDAVRQRSPLYRNAP